MLLSLPFQSSNAYAQCSKVQEAGDESIGLRLRLAKRGRNALNQEWRRKAEMFGLRKDVY